ncbi:MAG: SRPBCC family protein [Bacteroidota bacterium]
MKTLVQEQFLPISIEEAWDFFSHPNNLNAITPPHMLFNLLTELPDKMYEGLEIKYKVAPVLNIPLTWITKITLLNEPHCFSDEQIEGPYKVWKHEHHFKSVDGGVIMKDILNYDIGKGWIGNIAGKIFVHNKVKEIFEFRKKKLEELFGK